jgi:DNA-binding HxlR family transcriptional regulator
LFEGSTAGHDDSCLLARKLKEFEAAGFIVKDGQKSIHDENSIRFMREVIGMSKWHEEVLTNGLSLDLVDIPRKYREKNNVSALKNMEVLKEKVKEWEDDGFVERLDGPAWCCNPMSVAAKYDPVKDETKLRPCIDLSRHVNKHTRVSHAKLDDLTVAQELISRGDYMASFDLANQFFHVKLHQADKKVFWF